MIQTKKVWHRVAGLHRVRLSFEKDGEHYWLRCLDDGVGMTKHIIEKHLLVSGSELRAEVRALERKARSFGFTVGRTGQFGVGVLSYFMLCDRFEFTTRRSAEAGDLDSVAWQFSTEGIGTFGQLERASRSSKGTDVRLRLSATFLRGRSEQDLFSQILAYVKETLRKTPCRLEVRDETGSGGTWQVEPGWTWDRLPEIRLRTMNFDGPLTHDQRSRQRDTKQRLKVISSAIGKHLKYFGPQEFQLPAGKGVARLWLPYFELRSGNSLAYFHEVGRKWEFAGSAHGFVPQERAIFSFKGFRVHVDKEQELLSTLDTGILEIDVNEGPISSIEDPSRLT